MNSRKLLPLSLVVCISVFSNLVFAAVPPTCVTAYQRAGAVPGTQECPFRASAASVGLGNLYCTANSGQTTYIPQYCSGFLQEDQCNGPSNQITSIIGNPINIATGHKLQKVVDYSDHKWGDVNNPLELIRYYNSNTLIPSGMFGLTWRSNFDRSLTVSSTSVTVNKAVGGLQTFTLSGGVWVTRSYSVETLTEIRDSSDVRTGWRYVDANNTTEEYDVAGVLQSITNRHGAKLTLSYQNGRLYRVTDQVNRFIEFSFNANGVIQTVIDPVGQQYIYYYDSISFGSARQRLARVVYPDKTPTDVTDNPSVEYLYGEDAYIDEAAPEDISYFAFHLTGIVDENGDRYATFGYDSAGRANLTVHGTHDEDGTSGAKDNSGRMDVIYNVTSNSWQAQSFNAQGKQTNYNFNLTGTLRRASTVDGVASQNCAASSSSYTFDSNGFTDTVTDWNGNVTDYTINSLGLESDRTEAVGEPEQRTIETDWFEDLRLPREIREEGRTVAFTYENGRIRTRIETDTTNHTVPYSTSGRSRQWVYSYTYHDSQNTQVASITVDGPRTDVNDVHVYRYNQSGWLTESTNALNHTTRVLEHNLRGQPLRLQDVNGVVTVLAYHPRGWLERRTVQSEAGNVVTEYAYDDAGMIKTMKAPNGVALTYEYDTAHRLRAVRNNAGETMTLELDEFGNPSVREVRDTNNVIQQLVRREFDELGRLWKVIAPEGHSHEVYSYDGNDNPIRVENADGIAKIQAFDGLNRLDAIVDRENGNIDYDYDARNNLIGVRDQNKLLTAYTVDGFGFTIQESSPDRGVMVKRYDLAGNVTQEVSGRGIVTTYTYDAINRVKNMSVAGYPQNGATYIYDEVTTNGIANRGVGKLTGIEQASGDSQHFIFDDRGNITRVLSVVDDIESSTFYGYSLAGVMTSITYPSGRIVSYALDNLSRVSAITTKENASAEEQVVIQNVRYKPFGPMYQLRYGNDLILDKAYDRHYRIEGITSQGDSTTVMNLRYGYDDVGNIDSIDDMLDSTRTQTLGYDALSRLKSAVGSYGQFSYDYDPLGNREQVTWSQGAANFSETYITSSSVSNRLQQVQRTGVGAFVKDYDYSDSGNTVGDGTRTYEYDGEDRLVSVIQGGEILAQYRHNALGQRTRKIVANDLGLSRVFHYDTRGRLLAEADLNGEVLRDYVYLNDMPVAAIDKGDGVTLDQTDVSVTVKGDNGKFIVDEANQNGTVAFVVTVSNGSEIAAAADVSLDVAYPAGITIESVTPSIGTCTNTGSSCEFGELAPGATATVRVVVRQPAPADKIYSFMVSTATEESDLSNNSASGKFGGTAGCFIATAAFGSYAHPYLHILRNFRDDILLQSDAGTAFVESYYQHSPPLADWIARHEAARTVTQGLLLPVIALAAFAQMPVAQQVGAVGLLLLFVMLWVKFGGWSMVKVAAKNAIRIPSSFFASRSKKGGVTLHNIALALLLYAVLIAPATGWADTMYYIHSDNLNTPKVMTNQYQQVVWKGSYEPFGKVTEEVSAVENNLRFPGQYEDRETGLHYNYYRDFDPSLGRYVQSDPIGLEGGLSLYAYANLNPVENIDKWGLFSAKCAACWGMYYTCVAAVAGTCYVLCLPFGAGARAVACAAVCTDMIIGVCAIWRDVCLSECDTDYSSCSG